MQNTLGNWVFTILILILQIHKQSFVSLVIIHSLSVIILGGCPVILNASIYTWAPLFCIFACLVYSGKVLEFYYNSIGFCNIFKKSFYCFINTCYIRRKIRLLLNQLWSLIVLSLLCLIRLILQIRIILFIIRINVIGNEIRLASTVEWLAYLINVVFVSDQRVEIILVDCLFIVKHPIIVNCREVFTEGVATVPLVSKNKWWILTLQIRVN